MMGIFVFGVFFFRQTMNPPQELLKAVPREHFAVPFQNCTQFKQKLRKHFLFPQHKNCSIQNPLQFESRPPPKKMFSNTSGEAERGTIPTYGGMFQGIMLFSKSSITKGENTKTMERKLFDQPAEGTRKRCTFLRTLS